MEINLLDPEHAIARTSSDHVLLASVQDALDLMANCRSRGAGSVILEEKDIVPGFFDLRTGLLGEIMQKLVNYQFRLAIVGDFSKFSSKNFQDFLFESNKSGALLFLGTEEEALRRLASF